MTSCQSIYFKKKRHHANLVEFRSGLERYHFICNEKRLGTERGSNKVALSVVLNIEVWSSITILISNYAVPTLPNDNIRTIRYTTRWPVGVQTNVRRSRPAVAVVPSGSGSTLGSAQQQACMQWRAVVGGQRRRRLSFPFPHTHPPCHLCDAMNSATLLV